MNPGNVLGMLNRGLRERFHADLASANVCAPNVSSIALELWAKLAGNRSYWRERLIRNRSFQRTAAAQLARVEGTERVRTVMAYSYMALEIFRVARARGWRTVLGQIDAGPAEEGIVAKQYEENAGLHAMWDQAPRRYWIEWREECALADRIVVNSLWSKAALEAEGVSASKIRVVPLAYEVAGNAAQFRRHYPSSFHHQRPLRVLFLGQINLRKGISPLIDAIRLLRKEPFEFWFVGPIQVQIPSDLQEDSRVHWIGSVSRSDTEKFYREADVFMFPTFSDGFGITQLEAQTWRLPIIATKFCGNVVREGVNGWLLSEITAEGIAALLQRCLNRPVYLQELSDHAVLAKQFGLTGIGERWLDLFELE
jgi:glycosyltransferase involved in cell wall biosynthesis